MRIPYSFGFLLLASFAGACASEAPETSASGSTNESEGALSDAPAEVSSSTAAQGAEAAPIPGTKATYAGRINEAAPRADGLIHIDTAATLKRVADLHANTYVYLVWHAPEWTDFVNEFMPAAQAAGIKVWVYLTPPTEGSPTPYDADYVAWAKAIATQKKIHSNLTAWAIDDFYTNLTTFTPVYMQQMRAAASAIVPGLDLYVTAYMRALKDTTFLKNYASSVEGYIFPFRDEAYDNANSRYSNTMWTASADEQLRTALANVNAASATDKIFLMPYVSGLYGVTVRPDVNYVNALVSLGMSRMAQGKIPGVVLYGLRLEPGHEACPQTDEVKGLCRSDANRAHTGSGALRFAVEPKAKTTAGSFAAASTKVTLDQGSTTCSIVAYNTDTVSDDIDTTKGYHFKQILAGNNLLWERDVATDATDWYTNSPRDITPYLQQGSATLTVRLYEKKGVYNYPVDVSFDDIALTGCHIANPTFETPTGWSFTRSGDRVFGAVRRYDADYSSAVLDAVASQFQ